VSGAKITRRAGAAFVSLFLGALCLLFFLLRVAYPPATPPPDKTPPLGSSTELAQPGAHPTERSPALTEVAPPGVPPRTELAPSEAHPTERSPALTEVAPPGVPPRTELPPSEAHPTERSPALTEVAPPGAPARTELAPERSPSSTEVAPLGAPPRTEVAPERSPASIELARPRARATKRTSGTSLHPTQRNPSALRTRRVLRGRIQHTAAVRQLRLLHRHHWQAYHWRPLVWQAWGPPRAYHWLPPVWQAWGLPRSRSLQTQRRQRGHSNRRCMPIAPQWTDTIWICSGRPSRRGIPIHWFCG
jgi:hypothetical protein